MTHEVERVLADIDADHCVGFLRHGVLLAAAGEPSHDALQEIERFWARITAQQRLTTEWARRYLTVLAGNRP
jgi:hypothetical protein